MPGLFSEVYAAAEVAYRREQMLASAGRMHRRAHPFHWRRHTAEPPKPREAAPVPPPVRRPAPALYYPHRG